MLYRTVAVLVVLAVAGQALAQQPASPAAPAAPESLMDRVSYTIGMNMGRQFKDDSLPINIEMFARGLRDALSGAPSALSDEQIQATLAEFEQQMLAQQQEETAGMATKNKADGEAFLAANKAKPGVVTLPSGLQYKVVQEGTGPSPTAASTVSVHYRGTLIDGTEFDSSHRRGQPATFPVNGVIAGWTEALQLMKEGSKWELYIPATLAYGDRGQGPIGPNSVLVFEVELLQVQ